MKILVYGGKYDPEYWDASTPLKEAAALRRIFTKMEDLGYYESDEMNKKEATFYKMAKLGDNDALKRFMILRKDYEYEDWQFVEAADPLEP